MSKNPKKKTTKKKTKVVLSAETANPVLAQQLGYVQMPRGMTGQMPMQNQQQQYPQGMIGPPNVSQHIQIIPNMPQQPQYAVQNGQPQMQQGVPQNMQYMPTAGQLPKNMVVRKQQVQKNQTQPMPQMPQMNTNMNANVNPQMNVQMGTQMQNPMNNQMNGVVNQPMGNSMNGQMANQMQNPMNISNTQNVAQNPNVQIVQQMAQIPAKTGNGQMPINQRQMMAQIPKTTQQGMNQQMNGAQMVNQINPQGMPMMQPGMGNQMNRQMNGQMVHQMNPMMVNNMPTQIQNPQMNQQMNMPMGTQPMNPQMPGQMPNQMPGQTNIPQGVAPQIPGQIPGQMNMQMPNQIQNNPMGPQLPNQIQNQQMNGQMPGQMNANVQQQAMNGQMGIQMGTNGQQMQQLKMPEQPQRIGQPQQFQPQMMNAPGVQLVQNQRVINQRQGVIQSDLNVNNVNNPNYFINPEKTFKQPVVYQHPPTNQIGVMNPSNPNAMGNANTQPLPIGARQMNQVKAMGPNAMNQMNQMNPNMAQMNTQMPGQPPQPIQQNQLQTMEKQMNAMRQQMQEIQQEMTMKQETQIKPDPTQATNPMMKTSNQPNMNGMAQPNQNPMMSSNLNQNTIHKKLLQNIDDNKQKVGPQPIPHQTPLMKTIQQTSGPQMQPNQQPQTNYTQRPPNQQIRIQHGMNQTHQMQNFNNQITNQPQQPNQNGQPTQQGGQIMANTMIQKQSFEQINATNPQQQEIPMETPNMMFQNGNIQMPNKQFGQMANPQQQFVQTQGMNPPANMNMFQLQNGMVSQQAINAEMFPNKQNISAKQSAIKLSAEFTHQPAQHQGKKAAQQPHNTSIPPKQPGRAKTTKRRVDDDQQSYVSSVSNLTKKKQKTSKKAPAETVHETPFFEIYQKSMNELFVTNRELNKNDIIGGDMKYPDKVKQLVRDLNEYCSISQFFNFECKEDRITVKNAFYTFSPNAQHALHFNVLTPTVTMKQPQIAITTMMKGPVVAKDENDMKKVSQMEIEPPLTDQIPQSPKQPQQPLPGETEMNTIPNQSVPMEEVPMGMDQHTQRIIKSPETKQEMIPMNGGDGNLLIGYFENDEPFLTEERMKLMNDWETFKTYTKTPTIVHLLDLYFDYLKYVMANTNSNTLEMF